MSVVSLLALCEILEVPVTDLLPESAAKGGSAGMPEESAPLGRSPVWSPVLYKDECPSIRVPGSEVVYHWLSGPSQEHEIEAVTGDVPANHSHPTHTHVGEEFGYVLDGEVTAIIDGVPYLLRPGDSYAIKGARPHGFQTGPSGAKVLWFHTRRFMEWYASTRALPLDPRHDSVGDRQRR